MTNQAESDVLLAEIFSQTTLSFLSDLHCTQYYNIVYNAVLSVDAAAFDTAAWQIAASYILSAEQELSVTPKDAKNRLLCALKETSTA